MVGTKLRCAEEARPGRTTPMEPLNDEEKALAGSLAQQLRRITADAARSDGPCPPRDSLAARMATHLSRMRAESRAAIADAARRGDDASCGDVGANGEAPGTKMRGARNKRGGAASARAPSGAGSRTVDVDPAVLDGLRGALVRRLERARPELRATIERELRGRASLHDGARLAATIVDLKLAGEVDSAWRREIHMAHPELLDFRWRTSEAGAARAYWELRGPVLPGHPGAVVAGGYVPDIPGDAHVGGYFSVPFSHHLPPVAPTTVQTYHLRVLPLDAPGSGMVYGVHPGRVFGPASAPTAPEGIGPWSPPCVIRYGRDFAGAPTEFDIELIDVYRKAELFFDWFQLVEDQSGPGDEEFHIDGFVVEHTPMGSVNLGRIGPHALTLDPDDRSKHTFGKVATSWLGTPDTAHWPRTLTAVLSVMEEDDGGWMTDWRQSLDELLHDMLHGAFAADLQGFLNEMREQISEAQAELAAELAAETAAYITALIAASAREVVSAFIAVVVAWILAFIRTGAGDDFYGTQVYTLVLGTNDVARLDDGSAGRIVTSRLPAAGGTFAGAEQPNGSFRLSLTELQFLGLGSAEEGSPVSGIVQVSLHWEFKDRVSVYV